MAIDIKDMQWVGMDRRISSAERTGDRRFWRAARGRRLFGALAFAAASSKQNLKAMREVWADAPGEDFAPAWLHHKDLPWAADMIDPGLVLDRFDKTSPPSEGDMPRAWK